MMRIGYLIDEINGIEDIIDLETPAETFAFVYRALEYASEIALSEEDIVSDWLIKQRKNLIQEAKRNGCFQPNPQKCNWCPICVTGFSGTEDDSTCLDCGIHDYKICSICSTGYYFCPEEWEVTNLND